MIEPLGVDEVDELSFFSLNSSSSFYFSSKDIPLLSFISLICEMEAWFLITVTACIGALLWPFISTFIFRSKSKYPPGPHGLPIISRILWMRKATTEEESALRTLRSKFGPIVAIRRTSRPLIYISSASLAHEALVQKGAIFADRPKSLPAQKILNSNQHNINSAEYGPTWRILRRNLTSQILHFSHIKKYSQIRKSVVNILINRLMRASNESNSDGVVKVIDHFRFAMFCLLVFMCFGDKLDETDIKEIETIQNKVLLSFRRFQILNFWPQVTRIIFNGRWNELLRLRNEHEKILVRHIRARVSTNERLTTSYVDTLLNLELQDEQNGTKRKLTEGEMVTACSEFLNAGTDTTSTALQWIMANLVKYPDIQAKICHETNSVVGSKSEEISEDDLSKMPYLKAVVMESLRRHPPGHFLLPHKVTQEVDLGGYTIPRSAEINFTIAEMGWDPEVWEEPMRFKPERFLNESGEIAQELVDITGSREIKMMPFGAGRRICPGFGLAILHLEYFVANLVWKLKWEAVGEVDLSEKQEFTTVMKYPLHVRISPRQLT